MLTDYVLAGALGGLIAFVFSIPAIVLEITEFGKVKNVPLLVDVKTIFGLKIRHKHEVFFIGLLLHLVFGFLFGFVYVLFAEQGWLFLIHPPYTVLSLIIFALVSWVVVGLVIYPLLGLGIFGLKEGPHVWLETITSHLILAFSLWLLVQYFQPFFFNTPLL